MATTVREYVVLVTGFGANLNAPYGNATSNPASLVARSLPSSLPISHDLNSSGVPIRFLDPIAGQFAAIPGEYAAIRRKINELHEAHTHDVDLFVHLGRGPWSWVTVERRAFREDMTSSWLSKDKYYSSKDNLGQSAHELGSCPWLSVPIGLETSIDADATVLNAVMSSTKYANTAYSDEAAAGSFREPLEIHTHAEAGDKGCGFAYYESMANRYVQGRSLDVLFCHVPHEIDEDNVKRARDAILAIIGAAVKYVIDRDSDEPIDARQRFMLAR